MATLYRVRSTISYGAGGPGLSTHYFLAGSPAGTSTEALAAASGVHLFWVNLLGVLANTVAVAVQPAIDTIDETNGNLNGGYAVTPPALVLGTGASPYLPVFACLVVRYQTSAIIGTRRLEGRTYVGPLSSSASNAGLTPTTTAGTAAVNAVSALTGVGTPAAVVWHRPRVSPASIGNHGVITGGSALGVFGSLRSRRD
jgi:hypothetical protein